jgi:hypothetical protein
MRLGSVRHVDNPGKATPSELVARIHERVTNFSLFVTGADCTAIYYASAHNASAHNL